MSQAALFGVLALALVAYNVGLAAACAAPGQPHRVIEHYSSDTGFMVKEIKGVLTASECKDLIKFAEAKGMFQSQVWGDEKDKENKLDETSRKSRQAWIGDAEHRVAAKMATVSERLTGISKDHQEQLQVAVYDPKGMFVDHFDACVGNVENCAKMNRGAGQRRATLLVYLNDDFEGGETEFPEIGAKIKPEIGKGILFWSTREDESLIEQSKHRGNAVVSGRKWIATKWTHIRPWPIK